MWLELRITDSDGEPVTGQADTLEWRVENPGDVDPVVLEVGEKHGSPGVYEAPIVFTEPGEYVIHVEGTIEDTEVHTHFEKEVQDRSELDYPDTPDDELAVGPVIWRDFGLGVGIGAIAAVTAFLLGRRSPRTQATGRHLARPSDSAGFSGSAHEIGGHPCDDSVEQAG